MNYYYGMAWLLGLLLWQSPLYSQSVNLDSFAEVQALNVQQCAVVQVNAGWNYQNRVEVEKLAQLRPAFKKDGTVTAGNSSGINDASAGVLLMSYTKAKELGAVPLARIVSYAVAGVDPDFMGYGPIPATRKALEKAALTLDDIDLVEVNEAFAAQYLTVERELKLNREITNVNGSGIALGHPVACTGVRIIVTLIYEMKKRKSKLGLATLCSGGGMGMSTIIENVV